MVGRRLQVLGLVLIVLRFLCCVVLVASTVPDCAAVPSDIAYVKEDCFNATHRQVHTGKCIDGTLREESVTIVACKDYAPVPDAFASSSSETEFFCHRCLDHRVVCSELEHRPQACAAHMSDDTFCRQVISQASFSGCLSNTRYYEAIEYCNADRVPDAAISPKECASEYGGEFFRCLGCHDGIHVCAGTDAVECEQIGLPAASTNSTNDNEQGSDTAQDDSEAFGNFDCNQFWGDVQFYGEQCFNQTHRVVTTGLCIEGQVQGLSFQTSPCAADDEHLKFCHDCGGKAVCADTHIKFNLCDEHEHVRSCSHYYDQSSHFASCADEVRTLRNEFLLGMGSLPIAAFLTLCRSSCRLHLR